MASLNTAQIIGVARRYGQNIDEQEAGRIMNTTGGGDEGQVHGYFAPLAALQTQAQSRQDLLSRQTATENEFLGRFRGAIGGQETLPAMEQRLETRYGLPALRTNLESLRTVIQNLPADVLSRVQQFGGSEGQRRELLANRSLEVNPAFQEATRQFQTGEEQVQTGLQLGEQQQAKELQPFGTEAGLISDRLAREFTGYTQERQNEFELLLDKIKGQREMGLAELDRTTKLAIAEKQYLAHIESLKTIGKYGVYNPLTEQIIGSSGGGGGTQLNLSPTTGVSGYQFIA